MRGLTVLVLLGLLAACVGSPSQRIVGGTLANVSQYPFVVAVQVIINNNWMQTCGGTIVNNRSFMSAAHCFVGRTASQVGGRVGSNNAHSGGRLHTAATIRNHPQYNDRTFEHDISVIRVSTAFALGGNVREGRIAGPNYNVADNQQVWVIGWGLTNWGGTSSEQLRQVQILTQNQNTCRSVYPTLTANMLCAGWPAGGRGACTRDSGGPLIHNNVIIGVVSFGRECARPNTPTVYARVSSYSNWVSQNA